MAKYILRKLQGLSHNDKIVYAPDFAKRETVTTEEVAQHIQNVCSLKKSDVLSALTELGDYLSEQMAEGNSVKLDGLGVFTPMLKMDGVEEITPQDGSKPYLRVHNVHIDHVRFSVQRDVLQNANEHLNPVRSTDDGIVESKTLQTSVEERKDRIRAYLDVNPVLTVKSYMTITNMRRTMATRELKEWATGPDAFLQNIGSGVKHLYVLKNR